MYSVCGWKERVRAGVEEQFMYDCCQTDSPRLDEIAPKEGRDVYTHPPMTY